MGAQVRGQALARSRSASSPLAESSSGASGGLGGRLRRGLGLGRLLQDHVGVGAADAERGDAGPARVAVRLPGPRLGQQLDRARVPVDVRGRLVDVQGLRQHARAASPSPS